MSAWVFARFADEWRSVAFSADISHSTPCLKGPDAVFVASEPFVLFDEMRIPYELSPAQEVPIGRDDLSVVRFADVKAKREGPSLRRPSAGSRSLVDGGDVYAYVLDGTPFFARLLHSAWIHRTAETEGWSHAATITDRAGRNVAAVWRQPDGTLVLPFDPNEAMWNYRREHYRDLAQASRNNALRERAVWAYYRIRPLLPRRLQLEMRRAYSRVQTRTAFPRWPYEPALHDLMATLYGYISEINGSDPPWISPWPRPFSWALVLTHDVETNAGYHRIRPLRAVEEDAGFRSSWNFVPGRYEVEDAVVRELQTAGFEVGLHGLYHDGRDLESRAMLTERLPAMRAWAERWGSVGFRSPATQRSWELMGLLGFDYDSSYPDSDPYEPQPGGSCSWLPYFIGDLVELPITLPQDHTLFVILQHRDPSVWINKARQLRERGGLALLLTHPDYMVDERRLSAYASFLREFRHGAAPWRALPREVSDWWRRRALSGLEREGEGWKVTGPASTGALIVHGPPGRHAALPTSG